jgi:glycerate kinase
MRILVAPDKFKRSISAADAAQAIARGWRQADPDAELVLAPIADGGEGFAAVLCEALGGEWIGRTAADPLGREIEVRYAWIEEQKLAIIDLSEASGLSRLQDHERDPLRATTFGTGQLIRDAAERGARRILVGLGGSATTDGGIGLATALGFETLTSDGEELAPFSENLPALTRIRSRNAIDLPEIIAAADVEIPLLGARGTAAVFGGQKGADAKTIAALEIGLGSLADVVTSEFECDFRDVPGAGAAGGAGFGLMSFCGAKMQAGFSVVAEALQLEEQIAASDLVITGEGRIDAQTLEGKGPAGVARLARKHARPVLAFAGSVAPEPALDSTFDVIFPIVDEAMSLDCALSRGAELLERASTRAARLFLLKSSP